MDIFPAPSLGILKYGQTPKPDAEILADMIVAMDEIVAGVCTQNIYLRRGRHINAVDLGYLIFFHTHFTLTMYASASVSLPSSPMSIL